MSEPLKLLLIHPEGNFNNNPSLSGIMRGLLEAGMEIDVWATRNTDIDQSSSHPGMRVHLTQHKAGFPDDSPVTFPSLVTQSATTSADAFVAEHPRPDLVIGIDRGIIEASVLAQRWRIPCALISYELWFAEETSLDFKQLEIDACRSVSFVVCQDAVRSEQLCRENKIAPGLIMQVPVAGCGSIATQRNTVITDALRLSPETKIALYMGSITSRWSGIEEILTSTPLWPDNWALVLHHRYGNLHAKPLISSVFASPKKNIFFSPFPSLASNDLATLLAGADAGFAFYRVDNSHPLSGKNLGVIGMASGKAATYLQHGVPLVTNEIGEISDDIRKFHIGGVVPHGSELPRLLTEFNQNPDLLNRDRCVQYFEKRLDLNLYLPKLIARINDLIGTHAQRRNSLSA